MESRLLLIASDTFPLLADINPLVNNSTPTLSVPQGNSIPFTASYAPFGSGPQRSQWTTDGTAQGTHYLSNQPSDSLPTAPFSVVLANGENVTLRGSGV